MKTDRNTEKEEKQREEEPQGSPEENPSRDRAHETEARPKSFPLESDALAGMVRSGTVLTGRDGVNIQTLTIIGQIEGHTLLPEGQKSTKYEHMLPLLVAAEESRSVDGILLLLNTVGGDVEAGLAMAELIAGMETPTASLVLGGGHSIGVPLAVSADRSFIVPSATMTLHPVRMSGLVLGVPQSFTYLSQMQQRIASFVAAHAGISAQRFSELILRTGELATDMGCILDGNQAVQEGLIDCVGGLQDALTYLKDAALKQRNGEV